ncbi:hypothetical protein OIU76_026874 [Salix suchowensis]|nr:hypothetical protein OIU76_026874 [Salix suchowensis]
MALYKSLALITLLVIMSAIESESREVAAQGLELGLVPVPVLDQVLGQARPLHPRPAPGQGLMEGLMRALKQVPMLGLEQDQDQVADKVVGQVRGPVLDMARGSGEGSGRGSASGNGEGYGEGRGQGSGYGSGSGN